MSIRPISDFPGYCVTNDGRIWRDPKKGVCNKGKFLVPDASGGRALRVCLFKGGVGHKKLVHRLVLEAFVGPCPEGAEGCHNNGNNMDNRLDNLRWDTHSNNVFDAVKHGTHVDNKGSKNGRAKLNELQVRIIKRLLAFGTLIIPEIADIFNVAPPTVYNIRYNITWSHI